LAGVGGVRISRDVAGVVDGAGSRVDDVARAAVLVAGRGVIESVRRTRVRRGLASTVAGFRAVAEHAVVALGVVVAQTQARGIGDGERHTLSVNLNYPLDRFGIVDGLVRVSGTWRESSITDPVTGRDMAYSGEDPFSWSFGLSKEFNDGEFRAGFDASGQEQGLGYGDDSISISTDGVFYSAYAEYRATPDLTIRVQARDLSTRTNYRERTRYAYNNRDYGLVDSFETRVSQGGPSYEINIRRNF